MKIDVLSNNTVKITLNRVDMCDFDIKYETLSQKNPDTRRLLTQVLQTVKAEKNIHFDLSAERLFIEAFPRQDGGCMLYISCIESEQPSKKQKIPSQNTNTSYPPHCCVSVIKGVDTLIHLCKSLYHYRKNRKNSFRSALYANGEGKDQYYLVLYETDNYKQLEGIVKEYGTIMKDSALTIARIAEHDILVESREAVEIITDCLG